MITESNKQAVYYVVFCVLRYSSLAEAKTQAPEALAAHINRSKQLHEQGTLIMSGAFLDRNEESLSTMGVLTSREAAEAYIQADPFILNGLMSKWSIREWGNIFFT
jgi:uncharacterized protein